jgi:hypothetical protein
MFNTGVDGAGVPLGDQVLDPHYTLTVNPDSVASETYTSLDDGFPIPPWIANNSTSRWITVRPADDDSEGAPGSYTYQTTFTAPGSDTSVYGRLAVDDGLSDILVGGVSTGLGADNGFDEWQLFQLDIGAADTSVSFVVANGGTSDNPTGLRAEFYDMSAADIGWLSVLPANPITVASGASTNVTASISTTGLTPGYYRAFLRFANLDDCDPPNNTLEDPIIREINLTVTNWTVTPEDPQVRTFGSLGAACPAQTLDDVQFTVTNVGATTDATYSVAKSGDCDWLTLDKAGPIVVTPGNNDVVTGTVDASGLAVGDHTCQVVFTNVGTGLEERRTVTLSVVGAVWEYYGFDLDPDAADSAGAGLSFLLDEGTKQGSLVEDPDASDGWAYHIPDSDSAKSKWRTQPEMPFGGTAGVTIVARVKVTAHSGAADGGLFIWESGDRISASYHWGGPSGLVREDDRGVETTVTGDSEYHILRMTAEGGGGDLINVNLYLDEVLVLPMLGVSDRGIGGTISGEGLGFGAGSTSGTYDISFDWVSATNAGAFAPGEEVACLGRSLVLLNCPVPFADADEDGDVDQEDLGAFQHCFSGSEGEILSACGCYDRDGDSDVDSQDYYQFEFCATGPGVPFDPENPPLNCVP